MFAERLKSTRKNKGFTQITLGERVGLAQQTVASWESGKSYPDTITLAQLCGILSISADYLLGLTDDPTPRPAAQHQIAEDLMAAGDAATITDEELAARLPDDVRDGVMALIRLSRETSK